MQTAWIFAALTLTVAACSGQPQAMLAGADHPSAVAPGVWEYPAAEFPTMCISFLPNGELQFRGGFLFFNPGRWTQDARDGSVQMTLGGAAPFPFEAPRPGLAHKVSTRESVAEGGQTGAVPTADPAQRRLVYRLRPDTASLEFAGFNFYRKPACSAA